MTHFLVILCNVPWTGLLDDHAYAKQLKPVLGQLATVSRKYRKATLRSTELAQRAAAMSFSILLTQEHCSRLQIFHRIGRGGPVGKRAQFG